MSTLLLPSAKPGRLTISEMDDNFTALDTDKVGIGTGVQANNLAVWQGANSLTSTTDTVAYAKNVDHHVSTASRHVYPLVLKDLLSKTYKTYVGHVSTSTLNWSYNPDSLSVNKNGTGTVTITHNLNTLYYFVMASPVKGATYFLTVLPTNKATNSITLRVINGSGNAEESEIMFAIYFL